MEWLGTFVKPFLPAESQQGTEKSPQMGEDFCTCTLRTSPTDHPHMHVHLGMQVAQEAPVLQQPKVFGAAAVEELDLDACQPGAEEVGLPSPAGGSLRTFWDQEAPSASRLVFLLLLLCAVARVGKLEQKSGCSPLF